MYNSRYERQIFEYLENLKRYLSTRPIILGGVSSSGGGTGSPPGGFIGVLPQTRVAFDTTEAEDNTIPSGATLLDNLNRIRYRIAELEDAISSGVGGTIDVYSTGAVVVSSVGALDFYGQVSVSSNLDKAIIINPTTFIEDFTSNLPTTSFTTTYTIISGTLKVYFNGLIQSPSYYSAYSNYSGFTILFDTDSDDELVAEYQYYVAAQNITNAWGTSPYGTNPY